MNRLPRHGRLCLNCNLKDVEDVYHLFVFVLYIEPLDRNISTAIIMYVSTAQQHGLQMQRLTNTP